MKKDGYDRIEYLRDLVNEGDDASVVLKFTTKYKEKISEETLEILRSESNKKKIAEAVSDYKAVVRFCSMLEDAVALGERKEKALEKELKSRRN